MKYFLVVGEASGDLHASNLMKSLKEQDGNADFRFFGGEKMQQVGGRLLKHYREMAYMGFIPVLLNLRKIFKNIRDCRREIVDYQPDVVILVDYPGFNLGIAKFIKDNRRRFNRLPKTVYYISPKIWAWKEGRIKAIKRYVDRMYCIFPFETDFYKKHNYSVEYVGNPTVNEVNEFLATNTVEKQPTIALLPGSRKQEIKDNLPAMLEAASIFDGYRIVVAGAPNINIEYYEEFAGKKAKILFNQTYSLLAQSEAALVTSGTATLEAALFGCPQAVCYKTPFARISTYLWQHFFKVKYISLVNLIADREVVKELFGISFSVDTISNELFVLLTNNDYRKTMAESYREIAEKLGNSNASDNAAKSIVNLLK